MGSLWVGLGAVGGFLSVAIGAFGAHALKSHLGVDALVIFKTATEYQFWHSLALVLYGLSGSSRRLPGWAFVTGIVLFSGSLYVLALTGVRAWGAVTPFGGLAFLVGWAVFAWEGFRSWKTSAKRKPR